MKKKSRRQFSKDPKIVWHDRCYVCGATDGVEWHHVVPLAMGGPDEYDNLLPLCHSCHMKSHGLDPHIVRRKAGENGGRPCKWKKNTEDIFDDFVHCRISKRECCKRLDRHAGFTDTDRFRQYKKEHNIKSYRNNIDTFLSKHNGIRKGQIIGSIEYEDGTVEHLMWGDSEPITGESTAPTVDDVELVEVHQVGDEYINAYWSSKSCLYKVLMEMAEAEKNK